MRYVDATVGLSSLPGGDVREGVESCRPLVIERADLQTPGQRWGYRSLTVLCWLLWAYLFLPLLSVIFWVAGLTWAYQVLLQGLELADLWHMLTSYSAGIGVLVGIYLLWAITSYLRFHHADRRMLAPCVTDEQLANSHSLNANELASLRTGDRLVVSAEQLERMFGGNSA